MRCLDRISYEEVKENKTGEAVAEIRGSSNTSNGKKVCCGARKRNYTCLIISAVSVAVVGVALGLYFIIKNTPSISGLSPASEFNSTSNTNNNGDTSATNTVVNTFKQRLSPPNLSFGNISVICSVHYITASFDECLSVCAPSKCCQETAVDSCLRANFESCKVYSPCNFLEQEVNVDHYESAIGENKNTSSVSEKHYPLSDESGTFKTYKEDYIRRTKLIAQFQEIIEGPSPKYWSPSNKTDDYQNGDQTYQVFDANGRNFTIQPIFYEAMPYKNRSTAVFAWIGLPAGDVALNETFPAMVLVHGGGGTAFNEWVELWAKRGYAAISIAVEGQTDETLSSPSRLANSFYASHSRSGPKRIGVYGDWKEPIEDQWMFHAVADTILARLLLAKTFGDKVDSTRIGLMGISWGGVISCTVTGLTAGSRLFSHFIPAYGCGNLYDSKSPLGRALKNNPLYPILWDPCLYLSNASLPSLWMSWPEDPIFSMNTLSASYSKIQGTIMLSIIPHLEHGHQPIWNRPESYVFSEFIWRQNGPNETKRSWGYQISCEVITSQADNLIFRVEYFSKYRFKRAELVWSPDSDDILAALRRWEISEIQITPNSSNVTVVEASILDGAEAWMINIYTQDRGEGELVVTSRYQNVSQYLNGSEVEGTCQTGSSKRMMQSA